MGARRAVTLVCRDCKRRMKGNAGDVVRRSCERCGGELRIVHYSPPRKR